MRIVRISRVSLERGAERTKLNPNAPANEAHGYSGYWAGSKGGPAAQFDQGCLNNLIPDLKPNKIAIK